MEGRALPKIVPADVARRIGSPFPRMAIPLREEAMVVFHSLVVLGAFYYAAPLSVYLFSKLSPRARAILIAVIVVSIGHPAIRELEWIRSLPFWGAWHRYFSTRVVDENKPGPIPRRALIAAVPHGSFPFGAALGVSGWLAKYLGPLRPIAASATGLVPVLRHTMEGLGGIHANSEAMRVAMLDGRPQEMPNPWLKGVASGTAAVAMASAGGGVGGAGGGGGGRGGQAGAAAAQGVSGIAGKYRKEGRGGPRGDSNGSVGIVSSTLGAVWGLLGLGGAGGLPDAVRGRDRSRGILPGSRADRGHERFLVQPGGIAEMYRGTVMDVPKMRGAGWGSAASAGQQLDAAMSRSRQSGGRRPEVILLKNRKGFVRVALEAGMPIVPVYIFGCSTAMSIGWLSKKLEWVSRLLKASLVVFMGRWGLPVPRRSRFLYAIGKPLYEPPRVPGRPSQAEVDALHGRFVEAIVKLFHRYKGAAGWGKKELIVT